MSQALPQPAFAPTGGGPAAPPYRRAAAAPRRRRRSLWLKLLQRSALPLLALGVPAMLTFWVLRAPQFAFAEVQVESSGRVSAGWARSALAPLLGGNLLALPLAAADARLRQHPWVAAVDLHKELPHTLRITVRERQAGAVVEIGQQRFWVEASGRLIAPLAPGDEAPAALPRVRLEGMAPAATSDPAASAAELPAVPAALAVLAELATAEPGWRAELERITALSEEDFALSTQALPFPLLLGTQDVAARARVLAGLLPQVVARYPHLDAVDLRFSRRLVLVPGKPPAAGASTTAEYAEPVAGGAAAAADVPANMDELGQEEVSQDG